MTSDNFPRRGYERCPITIADLDASLAVQADRLGEVEETTRTYTEKLNQVNPKHEREIAVLGEQLAAVKADNAVLRVAINRIENRFWTLFVTTFFAALGALFAVFLGLVKK